MSYRIIALVLPVGLVACQPTPSHPPPAATAATAQPTASSTTASAPPTASASATGWAAVEGLVSKALADGFVAVDDGDLLDSQSPFVGVIVPATHGRAFYADDFGPASSFWTPNVGAVLDLAGRLRAHSWRDHPGIGERLHQYHYQITGIVHGSQQLLFVNAFCDPGPDWQRQSVSVDDGGDCYFQLLFDPSAKAITRLTVNGEA